MTVDLFWYRTKEELERREGKYIRKMAGVEYINSENAIKEAQRYLRENTDYYAIKIRDEDDHNNYSIVYRDSIVSFSEEILYHRKDYKEEINNHYTII